MIQRKKKKHPMLIAMVAISVIVVMVFIGFMILRSEEQGGEKMVQENTPTVEIPSENQEETTEYVGNSKEYYIDYVVVGDEQEVDKFLDIRIRFPNGEDYVVMTEKTITYMTDEGFYMYLDERELHMLSSARTDVEVYEGAILYLSSYSKKQENGLTEYPVNLFVLSAYGSYFEQTEQIYNRRIQLEENLLTFMNQTLHK